MQIVTVLFVSVENNKTMWNYIWKLTKTKARLKEYTSFQAPSENQPITKLETHHVHAD